MRFHLQNVENLIEETFKILLIIVSIACPLSSYQYEMETMDSISLSSSSSSSASSSSSSSSSSDISTAPLLLSEHKDTTEMSPLEKSTSNAHNTNKRLSMDLVHTIIRPVSTTSGPSTLEYNLNLILSTKQPMLHLYTYTQRLPSLPSDSLITTNDSNEIDSEDYVMTKHIASHDENDGISSHTTATTATAATEMKMAMEMTVVGPTASSLPSTQAQQYKHTHSHSHSHTHTHGHTHSRSLHQAQSSVYERFNKTQDLPSLSLLSFDDDDNDDDNEKDNEDDTTLRRRLAQQQQQQPHTDNISGNKINNRSNIKSPTTGNMTGMLSSFQHIGSQRIAVKFPETETASIPTPASTSNHNNSNNLNRQSNTKASNMKSATIADASAAEAIITSSSATATSGNGRKIESKYILPKPQKTDAPMLNYIFDTFSSANKHHHHDQRYGPHFEDVQRVGQPTNMTVQAGSSIHLNCRISLLQDKTVSWVRRNPLGENALDLLTVGLHTYTGDKRYKLEFQYPNNWRLKITNVKKDDEATYECQISTHPPRVIQINLLVNAPKVMIVDEFGDPLQEKYYEIDSTLQLSCIVRNIAMVTSVVYWKHGEDVLNYDVTRGGVSVKTELMDEGANSTLSIAKINKADSGNYTCSISEFQNFTIVVHILNGESFAELHHGGAAPVMLEHYHHMLAINLTLLILLLCLPATCIPR